MGIFRRSARQRTASAVASLAAGDRLDRKVARIRNRSELELARAAMRADPSPENVRRFNRAIDEPNR